MSTTLLTSILTLFSLSFSSLFIYLIAFTRRKDLGDLYFSIIWLITAILFGLMAIRTTFFALGYPEIDKIIAYIIQLLLSFLIISFGFFVGTKIKNRVIFYFFKTSILVLGFMFLFFLFYFGIEGPLISGWGTEYTASFHANILILICGFIAIAFLITNFIGDLLERKKMKKDFFKRTVLMHVSLIWFIFIGIIEQLGNSGWQVLFFRILLLISPLIAYFSIEEKDYNN